MKKGVTIIAIVLVAFIMISCVADISGVSIEKLEQEFRDERSDFTFDIEKSGNGYLFEYEDSDHDAVYSGTADNRKNITSTKFVYNYVKSSTIRSKNEMLSIIDKVLTGRTSSMNMADFNAARCFFDLVSLHSVCGGDENTTVDSFLDMLCYGETAKAGDWTIVIENSGNKVTIESFK